MSGRYGSSEIMTTTTKADKAQMQSLNDRLSDYMMRMRKMVLGNGFDPAKYHEAMKILEEDVNKMKNLYNSELEKLRRALEESNREKNALVANQGTVEDLQRRAAAEADKARRLQDDINKLQRILAEKEKEIAGLRAELQTTHNELQQIKPHYNQMLRDGEDWKKRFENEAAARKQAEDRVKNMEDKLTFADKVKGQEIRDLTERLRTANELIKSLEDKIKQLSASRDDGVKDALQRMREGTMFEMRKHQKETEDALNQNLAALKRQMDEEARMREALARDRDALAEKCRQLEDMLNKLQAENAANEQQKRALEDALNKSRAGADADRKDLEKQVRELANMNMEKVKDLNNARDAQGSLKAEIDTYQRLLDVENQRIEGKNNSAPPASRMQSRTGSPGKPPVAATPPTTYRTSFKNPSKNSLMGRGTYQYPSGGGSQNGFPNIAGPKYTGRF